MSARSLRRVYLTIFVMLAVGGLSAVDAQQTTERYIPIGESPGVSGAYSYIGEIVAVDMSSRRLTLEDESGRHTMRVTDETRIWLDRSQRRLAALEGSYEDCQVGRRVEIMHMNDDPMVAEWVKVETQ